MHRINPATGEPLEPVEGHDVDDVDAALDAATRAYRDWSDTRLEERRQLLTAAAEVLTARVDEFAELMTREMGKPIAGARSEVEKCAWVCEHYAERAPEYLADERIGTEPGARSFVSYEPLGPVLAVMPWNYPIVPDSPAQNQANKWAEQHTPGYGTDTSRRVPACPRRPVGAG